jgi:hypothetical protein
MLSLCCIPVKLLILLNCLLDEMAFRFKPFWSMVLDMVNTFLVLLGVGLVTYGLGQAQVLPTCGQYSLPEQRTFWGTELRSATARGT